MKTPIPAKPNRRLGQNFLTDSNIADKIIQFFGPTAQDHVLEIGAGTGALTARLAQAAERIIAVEIDPLLTPILEQIPRVEVLQTDIRELDLSSLQRNGKQLRIIGNLPYYISTAIVTRLIEQRDAIADMVLMFQDEVAQRIVSEPSHHEYGYLSAVTQYFCRLETGFRISKNCFIPKPQIESRVLRFQFRNETVVPFAEYTRFLAVAFSQRRKKLRNNLIRSLEIAPERLDAIYSELGIQENIRAENLSPAQFERLILALR